MAAHGPLKPMVGSMTNQKSEANMDAKRKKKADVVDTINNCDLGKTIWKKKQRNGAKPIAAEPHTSAVVSTVLLNIFYFNSAGRLSKIVV